INGYSGIGKSHFIRLLSYKFIKIAFIYNFLTLIVCATPIGVAANNIDRYTLYSLLQLPFSIGGLINL
ncbi:hypothetical protein GE21DRAFT_1219371, partial [Neurospora crassa]